jgi:DNA-binding transcriptional regulator YiaG
MRFKMKYDELLRKAGITRKELGAQLGLHYNTVYNWEEPPEYAMAYLRLLVENNSLQHIKEAVKHLRNE